MALSAERIELGRTRVGGSFAGVLLGVHPWATPLDLFNHAIYDVPITSDEDEKRHLSWGTRVERPALDQFAAERGWHLRGCPGPLTDPRFPAWVVTPDDLAEAESGLLPLDAKNVSRWNADKWGAPGTSDAPLYCLAQVQVQIALCEQLGVQPEGCLVATIAGDPPEPYPVKWDAEVFGTLNELAAKFVRDCLIPRRPPDGWEEDRHAAEYIAKRFASTTDETIRKPTREDVGLLLEFRAAKLEEKAAAAKVSAVEARLAVAVGEKRGIEGVAKWIDLEPRTETFTDWNLVAQEFALRAKIPPEEAAAVAAQYVRTKVVAKGSRYLRPSTAKNLPTVENQS